VVRRFAFTCCLHCARVTFVSLLVVCLAACSSGSSTRDAGNDVSPTRPSFPAAQRLDTSRLVVYQVWINYYARNVDDGQDSSDAFANAGAHLKDIAAMGVTAIQLSPIHPFGQDTTVGATYSVRDFYAVNPGYSGVRSSDAGARQRGIAALKRYIDRAHGLGLQVLMDCVYHSTEPDSVLVSQHPDFYKRTRGGRIVRNQFGFAALDYDLPAVRSYMIDMTEFWARSVGFDGCRADLATAIPVSFWAMLNNELKRVKPSWLMIGEVAARLGEYAGTYSGPGFRPGERYDKIYAFDAIYGVAYMSALRRVINGAASAELLRQAWTLPDRLTKSAPPGTVLYRGVDNHDQRPRAAALAGGNEGMLAAMAVSFTIDGIPFIFNGQEVGDTNPTSLYTQQYIDWMRPRHPEDAHVFKNLLTLRRTHPTLAHGTTTWCATSEAGSVISYLRTSTDERIVVVVNLSSQRRTITVTVPPGQSAGGTIGDLNSGRTYRITNHSLDLTLAPYAHLIGAIRP
jgi:cyclomaltodextrinase / maltogenic alpha-amylase / neopullulanase